VPTTATQSITFRGLTYNNSTFDVTTAAGLVAIGNGPGTPNVDNLGAFTQTGTPFVYTGQHFGIRVTFAAPPMTVPDSVVIADLIIGTVSAVDNGGIFIDLDNSVHHFTFGSGDAAGSFDFFVNDVSLIAGHSVSVTGTIITLTPTTTAIPEPGAYALLLAGLGVLVFVAGRRKR
jgi:PEP-CTERM motif